MSNTDSKLFTVAGTSFSKGKFTARFANELKARIKSLENFGDTDINLVELPVPLTKLDAISYLKANPAAGVNIAALTVKEESIIASNTPKVPKEKKPKIVKEKKPTAEKKSKTTESDVVEGESIVNTIISAAKAPRAGSIRAKALAAAGDKQVETAATSAE